MLLLVTYNSSLFHTSHVIGYSVTGQYDFYGNASLLDVNTRAGFITRVRKTESLSFPHRGSNFVSRLLPLITLACNGKRILDETIKLLDRTPRPINMSTGGDHWSSKLYLTINVVIIIVIVIKKKKDS
ncbi:hypothetical protein INT45_006391 [Circinella minor]|uniref:Uncharacterized protein n=1 Tax=Circinella minor TaxID=1195481 RepID=A0A8H7SCQ9_9FUNG|nr:hypothetical protein INT45_006391 [Circinella minor]